MCRPILAPRQIVDPPAFSASADVLRCGLLLSSQVSTHEDPGVEAVAFIENYHFRPSVRSVDRHPNLTIASNMQDAPLEIAVAAGLAATGLISVPALSTFITQLTTREPKPETYEDKDGRATPESVEAYSAKWPKTFVVLFAFLATGSSIATAILTTIHTETVDLFLENWLSAAASVSQPPLRKPPPG